MKNVLMISRAFPPFLPVGHSIRVVKFIKFLPTMGWQPCVLTIDDHTEYEWTKKVGSESLLSEVSGNVKIFRTRAGEISVNFLEKEDRFASKNSFFGWIIKFFRKSRNWLSRNFLLPDILILWLPHAFRAGIRIVKSEDIDVIFCTCPPHSALFVGVFIKLFTHKPLILDYRDDWIGTPWFDSKNKIRQAVEKKLEKWAVQTADKVILVTELSQKVFRERYTRQEAEKFVLIPNGCELADFVNIKPYEIEKYGSKFLILHAGSLNESKVWGRSASGLFEAVRNILDERPILAENLMLVFAGDLPEGHRRMANEMGISSVIESVGHLPHPEALALMSSAQLLLAINYEGWSTIIPGKIYEYWAVGGPPILLLSCPGAAAELVQKYRLGFSLDPLDAEGIKRVILDIMERDKSSTPYRINTKGIQDYDRRELTRKLAGVLSSVTEP